QETRTDFPVDYVHGTRGDAGNGTKNIDGPDIPRDSNDKESDHTLATEELRRQVVIIGSGPAGLTAAIYTSRASMQPLLIDAPADMERQTTPGGQLMITTDVENYPGFAKGIEGPELMVQFRQQAERFGTEFLEAWINKVDLSKRPFTLYTDNKIIIAE